MIYTRDKVAAILHFKNNWDFRKIKNNFYTLNGYRNSINFIHPTFIASDKEDVISKESKRDAYDHCINLLKFISQDLLA